VHGREVAPFERQGYGRLRLHHNDGGHAIRDRSWRGIPLERRGGASSVTFLQGLWWKDALVVGGSGATLQTNEAPPTILLSHAAECRHCLTVYCSTSRTHRCRGPPLAKGLADTRGLHTRPAPTGTRLYQTAAPAVHIVGYDGVTVSAFVKQNVSFETGQVLGGAMGSFSYVELHEGDPDSSLCFAAKCRETLSCRRR
jgi:hypothetical protein